jgi:hypothetical protein
MVEIKLKVSEGDKLPFEGAGIFVIGSPKTGKTVLACTASQYAPQPLNPKVRTVLPDVCFVQLEPNGLKSATALGLVPKHVIDLSGSDFMVPVDFDAVPDSKSKTSNDALLDWTKVRPALLAVAKYVKQTPEIKIVVIDNMSGFCEMTEAYFQKVCLKDGKPDTFGVYSEVKKAATWVFNLFRLQKVLVIGLSHTKTSGQQDLEKLETKSVGGEATSQVAAMPAGSAGFWAKATDATVCTMRKKVKAGTTYRYEYKMAVTSSQKLPAGNRWNIEGEIDSHLRKIVADNYPELFFNKDIQ